MAINRYIFIFMMLGTLAIQSSRVEAAQLYQNNYCSVATYVGSEVPDVAMALPISATQGKPVILLNSNTLSLPHISYIVAHECCHHTLHHTQRDPHTHTHDSMMAVELEADQCAADLLKARGEYDAIHAAITQARLEGQHARALKIAQRMQTAQGVYGFE